jgi:hypothetical protein
VYKASVSTTSPLGSRLTVLSNPLLKYGTCPPIKPQFHRRAMLK